jgi:amidophosphoribosyltransferase
MTEDEMRDHLGVDSLKFISIDGLYRAVGQSGGRDAKSPQYCDACFTGEYPITPTDMIERGFKTKVAAE